jgi:hypothetical protein
MPSKRKPFTYTGSKSSRSKPKPFTYKPSTSPVAKAARFRYDMAKPKLVTGRWLRPHLPIYLDKIESPFQQMARQP